jgi:co-chaperonin GroES (HSP10)
MKLVPQNSRVLAEEMEQDLIKVNPAEGTGAELYRFKQFKVVNSVNYKKGTVVFAPEYTDKILVDGKEYRIMHESDIVLSLEK